MGHEICLDTERRALEGDHLCNAFNIAAGVPEERRHEIDMVRRQTAADRIAAAGNPTHDSGGRSPSKFMP